MVSRFLVFGSCNSRDIFNSTFNKDYKQYFEVVGDSQRTSIISLMQDPVFFDENQIQICVDGQINQFRTNNVREDLNKNFLDILRGSSADYLLMDNHFEIDAGILELEDGTLLTHNNDIMETNLYKELEKKRAITIQNNPDEYLKLYSDNCNSFFDFLEEFCPNIKVILNVSRWVPNILKLDGDTEFSEEFQKRANNHNKYRYILDKYILDHFDVDVLPFNKNTRALEGHWGCTHPSHFELSYIKDKDVQLKEIINRNKLLDYSDELREINKKIRQLRRENLVLTEENQQLFYDFKIK